MSPQKNDKTHDPQGLTLPVKLIATVFTIAAGVLLIYGQLFASPREILELRQKITVVENRTEADSRTLLLLEADVRYIRQWIERQERMKP